MVFIKILFLAPFVELVSGILTLFGIQSGFLLNYFILIVTIISIGTILVEKKRITDLYLLAFFWALCLLKVYMAIDKYVEVRELLRVVLLINNSYICFNLINKELVEEKYIVFSLIGCVISFVLGLFGIRANVNEVYLTQYNGGLFVIPHIAGYYLLFYFLWLQHRYQNNQLLKIFIVGMIFLTGVRSVIVALTIYLAVSWIVNVLKKKRIKKKTMLFVAIGLLFGFVIVLLFSTLIIKATGGLVQNILVRLNELLVFNDSMYGSGRALLTKIIINKLADADGIKLFFGTTNEELFDLTSSYFGTRIWAHNDFLNLLFTTGVFGTLIYLYFLYIKPAVLSLRQKNMNSVMPIVLLTAILAITNGLYTYSASWIIVYLVNIIVKEKVRNSK
jgi:hypothetical protein